jgi:hypothetical protein
LLLKPIMESFLIPKRLLFISDTNWWWSERINGWKRIEIIE